MCRTVCNHIALFGVCDGRAVYEFTLLYDISRHFFVKAVLYQCDIPGPSAKQHACRENPSPSVGMCHANAVDINKRVQPPLAHHLEPPCWEICKQCLVMDTTARI